VIGWWKSEMRSLRLGSGISLKVEQRIAGMGLFIAIIVQIAFSREAVVNKS